MRFKDFHGYMVWEDGSILSKQGENKYLIPHQNKNGYWIVKLNYNNKTNTHYVHRLVAELFCNKPDGCDIVDHLDRNKSNNCACNLEWVDRAENARRAVYAVSRQDCRIGKNMYTSRDICKTQDRPAHCSQVFA